MNVVGESGSNSYINSTDYKIIDIDDTVAYKLSTTYTSGSKKQVLTADSMVSTNDQYITRAGQIDLNYPSDNSARIIINYTANALEQGPWKTPDSFGRSWYYKDTSFDDDTPHEYKYALRCWGGDATVVGDGSATFPQYLSTVYYFTDFASGGGTEQSAAEASTGRKYAYVDIPKNITAFKIVLLNTDDSDKMWFASSTTQIVDDDTFSTCYFMKSNRATAVANYDDCYIDFESKPIIDAAGKAAGQGVGGNLMKWVLESCNTCSDDKRNGYGNISLLVDNFYINPTTATKNTPVYTIGGVVPFTVEDIVGEMQKRESGNGSSSAVRIPRDYELDSSRIVIIVVISSLSLMAFSIITLYINKKRKHS